MGSVVTDIIMNTIHRNLSPRNILSPVSDILLSADGYITTSPRGVSLMQSGTTSTKVSLAKVWNSTMNRIKGNRKNKAEEMQNKIK